MEEHNKLPLVSVGLPVFNGAEHIRYALDSILAQTLDNIEIIISDNASTDGTDEICQDYAARDKRIRYSRSDTNLGAAPNFNKVFGLAQGKYFQWAAHDDVYDVEFLRSCVTTLEADPEIVLCFPEEVSIDAKGKFLCDRPYGFPNDIESPQARFKELLRRNRGSPPIFGVVRTEILRKTPLIGSYYASDQVLLAELALHGKFHQISEKLLLHREHQNRSVYNHTKRGDYVAWFNTRFKGKLLFPEWRFFTEYFRAIYRSPLSYCDKTYCYFYTLRSLLIRNRWKRMIYDVGAIMAKR